MNSFTIGYLYNLELRILIWLKNTKNNTVDCCFCCNSVLQFFGQITTMHLIRLFLLPSDARCMRPHFHAKCCSVPLWERYLFYPTDKCINGFEFLLRGMSYQTMIIYQNKSINIILVLTCCLYIFPGNFGSSLFRNRKLAFSMIFVYF